MIQTGTATDTKNPAMSMPDEREVSNKAKVSGQLEGLLSGDSKYIQNARNNSAETSNRKGLLFSSMSAGAGEKAAIEAAMPIAQQDAQTEGNQSLTNQAASNTFRQQNSDNLQQMKMANLDFENSQAMANLNSDLEKGIIDQKTFANFRGQFMDSMTSVINEANISISEIQSASDIPAAEKTKMVNQLIALRDADLEGLQTMFKLQPMWQQNWADV